MAGRTGKIAAPARQRPTVARETTQVARVPLRGPNARPVSPAPAAPTRIETRTKGTRSQRRQGQTGKLGTAERMTEVLGRGLPAQLYIAAPSGTWERREPKQYRLTPAAEAPATGKRRRSIRVRGTEPPLARNSSALSERGRPLRRVNSGAATARAPDWAAGASWGEAGRQVTASRDAFAQANVPNPRQPVREHLPRRSQARRQPAVDGPGGRASGTAVC